MTTPHRRILSLWLPRFSTDRVHRRWADQGQLETDKPLALIARQNSADRVMAVDEAARHVGLEPGLTLGEARALVPGLRTAPLDPAGDAHALEAVARWAVRYTPWTAPWVHGEAQGLWLDISGCAHLFAGEHALLTDLCDRLSWAGYAARGAIADTPGAAWALARFGEDALTLVAPGEQRTNLCPLPVEALRLDDETVAKLHRFGLRTIETLLPLPRASLAARAGYGVGEQLDRALGRTPEPIQPLSPPPQFRAHLRFAEPVGKREDFDEALIRLLETVGAQLRAQDQGARRLAFTLFRLDGSTQTLRVGTSKPSRDKAQLARLFRESFDKLDPGFGVETVLLAIEQANPLHADQLSHNTANRSDGLTPLLDRLINRLGPDAICRLVPQDRALPEEAETHTPPTTALPEAPPQPKAPRPIGLLGQPEPVSLTQSERGLTLHWRRVDHPLVQITGPERIAPEWWRDLGHAPPPPRDYYACETEGGLRAWLYRDQKRWYLQGVFS